MACFIARRYRPCQGLKMGFPLFQLLSFLLTDLSSGGVRVRFRLRFQAVKVSIFSGLPLGTQLTRQPPQSSSKGNLFVRVRLGGVPSTVEKVIRVRFCCLLIVERPTQETQAQQYSDTVLFLRRKPKGDGGKGTGKKSRQFATIAVFP